MDETGARKRIAAGRKAVAAARGGTNSGTNSRTKRGQATPSATAKPARNPRAGTGSLPVRDLVDEAAAAGADIQRARWRDVLGLELATRIAVACAAAGEDPAEWCQRQLADSTRLLEGRVARQRERQRQVSRCPHADKDRRGNRCGACGTRGLPAVT